MPYDGHYKTKKVYIVSRNYMFVIIGLSFVAGVLVMNYFTM